MSSETSHQRQNESSFTALCNLQRQRVILRNRSQFLTAIIHNLMSDVYLASTDMLMQSVIPCVRLHSVLIKTKQRE
jgi:hypothetical protein